MINWFKIYNSVGFGMPTDLNNHHCSHFRTFLSLHKKSTYTLKQHYLPPRISPHSHPISILANQCASFCLYGFAYSGIFHINKIISVWSFMTGSFPLMFSRIIHGVVCVSTSFLKEVGWKTFSVSQFELFKLLY